MKALQEGTCSLCYRPVKLCCAVCFCPLVLVMSVIPKAVRSAIQLQVARSRVDVLILYYFRVEPYVFMNNSTHHVTEGSSVTLALHYTLKYNGKI